MPAAILLAACTSGGSPSEQAIGSRTSPSGTAIRAADEPNPGDDGARSQNDNESDARVQVHDRKSRRTTTGSVPDYVELDGASVEADDGVLVFALRLVGPIPTRMPAREVLRVMFQLLKQDGERVNVVAQGSQHGWTAWVTVGQEEKTPGTLRLDGEEIQIEIDRAHVDIRPFRWLASIAWTKGQSYAFDSAPERGYAEFPN